MASYATPLLFSTLLFLAVPTTKPYPIDTICKQTKKPEFCSNLLASYSGSSTLLEIERAVIDKTFISATQMTARIQQLLPTTTDPNLRLVFDLCSDYYGAAISALTEAKKKVESGEYAFLKYAAGIAAKDAALCRRAFARAGSEPVPIVANNVNFDLLSDVFLAVSKLLLSGK